MRCIGHSLVSFFLAALIWGLSPLSVVAQTTLYVLIDGDVRVPCGTPCQRQPALWEIDVEHARIRSQTYLPSGILTGPGLAATADGRYLVWLGTDGTASPSVQTLNLFDRRTRTSTELLRQPMPQSGIGAWLPVLSHPTDLRVFAQFIGQLPFAMDVSGTMPLDPGIVVPQVVMENLTESGDAIMLRRRGGATLMNADTGAILHQVTGEEDTWAVNREGTELYSAKAVIPPFATSGQRTFRRYDAATGAILAERVDTAASGVRSLRIDPRTGRIFADLNSGGHEVLAADSLASLGQVASTFLPSGATGRLAFDMHQPRAYLLATWWLPGNVYENSIEVLDTDSLATIGGGRLPTALAAAAILVVPRPPAPASLTAAVEGARVTLQWTHGTGAGLATGYRLEAGSQVGSNDLAVVDLGTSLQLAVDGVPPGVYHVRVRATNFEGASAPSNEVTITVP